MNPNYPSLATNYYDSLVGGVRLHYRHSRKYKHQYQTRKISKDSISILPRRSRYKDLEDRIFSGVRLLRKKWIDTRNMYWQCHP